MNGAEPSPSICLVLVEAALELVPPECQAHPAVVRHARRKGKDPSQILLDRAYHHAAFRHLPDAYRRGRPDIIHFCLLEALGSPLNLRGMLRVFVSTYDGFTIRVSPLARLPRVYERFNGLMEQLYAKRQITADRNELLSITAQSLRELVAKLRPTRTYLFSEQGGPLAGPALGRELVSTPRPLLMVGAFPHGKLGKETQGMADRIISLFGKPLEAWVAVSRVLCAVEDAMLWSST